jgi:hypothetical protein
LTLTHSYLRPPQTGHRGSIRAESVMVDLNFGP